MTELRQRTTRAFASQGLTSFVGKVVSLSAGIILARLLFPDDYGHYALAMIVANLVQLLSTAGFQSYLIQAAKLDRHVVDLCYTLNLIFAWALCLVVAVGAWLWPGLPDELRLIIALYGVQVGVSGLSYVPLAMFKRELDFHVSSRAELANVFTSWGVRIGLAASGAGALCFPIGDLAGAAVRHLYVWRRSTVRPSLVWPHTTEARPVLWFGMHATSSAMAGFVANQIDKILLGASFTVAQIGLYSFGSVNAALFYSAFIVPQVAVFQAAYARCRDDLAEARRLLIRSSRMLFSLSLPVHALLILETERVVTAIFSDRWLASVPLIQIFAFDYLVRSLLSGIPSIQIAFGHVDRAAITKWQNAAVFVVALVTAAFLEVSLTGYALAYVGANLIASWHNVVVNGRLVELRYREYLVNLVTPALLAAVSTAGWYGFTRWFGDRGLWPTLIASSLAWVVPYGTLTLFFNREVISGITSILRRRGGR